MDCTRIAAIIRRGMEKKMTDEAAANTPIDNDDAELLAIEEEEKALVARIAAKKAAKAARAEATLAAVTTPTGKPFRLPPLPSAAAEPVAQLVVPAPVTGTAKSEPMVSLDLPVSAPVVETPTLAPVVAPVVVEAIAPVVAPEVTPAHVTGSDPALVGRRWYATGARKLFGTKVVSPSTLPVDHYKNEYVYLKSLPTPDEDKGATTPEAVAALVAKYGVEFTSWADGLPK